MATQENVKTVHGVCLWCEGREKPLNEHGLCVPCADQSPAEVLTAPRSDLPLVNDLRDAYDRNPAHSLYESAADLIDALYLRLSLAAGVIDQAGIIWMGETETRCLLERARGAS